MSREEWNEEREGGYKATELLKALTLDLERTCLAALGVG